MPLPSPEGLRLAISWAIRHEFAPLQSFFSPQVRVGWLWRVERGSLEVSLEGANPIRVEEGCWLWHPSSRGRLIRAQKTGAVWETVGLSALVGARDWWQPPAPRIWQSANDERGALLIRLLCDFGVEKPIADLESDGLARSLCAWLWRENLDVLPKDAPAWVDLCLRKIEAEPGVSVEELAGAAHFSPSQFRRVWEAHFGLSPRDFLMNRRLERAQVLMQNGGDSLEIVAQKSGFASAANLSRAFRARIGQSPLDWKRSRREKGF